MDESRVPHGSLASRYLTRAARAARSFAKPSFSSLQPSVRGERPPARTLSRAGRAAPDFPPLRRRLLSRPLVGSLELGLKALAHVAELVLHDVLKAVRVLPTGNRELLLGRLEHVAGRA